MRNFQIPAKGKTIHRNVPQNILMSFIILKASCLNNIHGQVLNIETSDNSTCKVESTTNIARNMSLMKISERCKYDILLFHFKMIFILLFSTWKQILTTFVKVKVKDKR